MLIPEYTVTAKEDEENDRGQSPNTVLWCVCVYLSEKDRQLWQPQITQSNTMAWHLGEKCQAGEFEGNMVALPSTMDINKKVSGLLL